VSTLASGVITLVQIQPAAEPDFHHAIPTPLPQCLECNFAVVAERRLLLLDHRQRRCAAASRAARRSTPSI
jgi:hypothetical protein